VSADVDLNPEPFQIQPWEAAAMKKVYSLIPSPRAAKRFVNVYRLLRVQVPTARRDRFIGDAGGGEHRAAILLLGILVGYPNQATELMEQLLARKNGDSWWEFIDSFSSRDDDEWHQLLDKLRDIRRPKVVPSAAPEAPIIPDGSSCQNFRTWTPHVARYAFQSARLLIADSTRADGDIATAMAILPTIGG
jgi:hypothetical protein